MSRVQVLSEITRDMAQVFFASVVVDPLLSGAFNMQAMAIGLLLAGVAWVVSVMLIK